MYTRQVAHQAGAYPDFFLKKYLMDLILVHYRATPSIKFAGTHLYTWVDRSSVRVKCACLAQEHKSDSDQGLKPKVERPNH